MNSIKPCKMPFVASVVGKRLLNVNDALGNDFNFAILKVLWNSDRY